MIGGSPESGGGFFPAVKVRFGPFLGIVVPPTPFFTRFSAGVKMISGHSKGAAMSDDKKAGGDLAADQAAAPIKPDEVVVTVKPRHENAPPKRDQKARDAYERRKSDRDDLADKASDGATKEVREAIKKAAPKGREAQKDAADKAAQDVSEKLPQRIFKEVQVDIPGEHPITKPATEGPPPDPPPPKKGI